MAPAISDSEDDDEILLDDGPSQRSTYSTHVAQAEAILESFPGGFDGANDQPTSTTSSELRRQILSAERNLCATASLGTPAMASTTSPVLLKDKRRRTTVVGSEPIASPPKSVKRSKTSTVKTYGKSNRTFQADDPDAAFAALRDDTEAPRASQSARFTEHSSGPNVSSGLPAGTIGEDFINHEPNVIFKDTGSTNAFNESSQQRLIEQALNDSEKVMSASHQKQAASTDRQQSSSFPWSASADATQSPATKQTEASSNEAPQPDAADDMIAVATKPSQFVASKEPAEKEVTNAPERMATDQSPAKDPNEVLKPSSKAPPPKSSPVVEIPRYQPSQDHSNAEPENSSRGRKRKAQDEPEEQLNSDDKAIGLPKENYKPRPSRRRATAAVEEPIDYSMIPEKAIKKRRKTAEAKIDTASHQADDVQAPSITQSSKTGSHAASNADPKDDTTASEKAIGNETKATSSEPAVSPQKGSQQSNAPSPKGGPASSKKAQDAMVMKPPSLPASASKKPRRSKTTIFEDHVELNRTQKVPTLSQQQANRKSALAELSNDAKPDKRKKRRTIAQDDDDEEDELAKDMSEDEDDAPPKRRGRPAKAKPRVKSKEKVLEDPEDEEDELELEEEEPPKKEGRGRPRKIQPDEPSKQKETTQQRENTPSVETAANTSSDVIGQSSPSKAALERKDANARPSSKDTATTNKDTPAPSPGKPTEQPSKNLPSPEKTPAKPSPSTTHSPIKGSSFANYRVGLSRRSRIPSLLKSFRAPAPPRR